MMANIINKLVEEAHETAQSKGWWNTPRTDGECIALMHAELSEALEALRVHDAHFVVEELADCCIRIFDYCGAKNLDLGEAIEKKMAYNKVRPYKHGGKQF